MSEDQKFEIERAFDLIPHVIGSSWTTIWFRFNEIKHPTRDEYRKKVIEYIELLEPIFQSYSDNENLQDVVKYIKWRKKVEIEKISNGLNKEVEVRYDRYLDIG